MAGLPSFDELPDHGAPAPQAPTSFDDIPDSPVPTPAAPTPVSEPAPEAPAPTGAAMDFDSLPDHAAPSPSPVASPQPMPVSRGQATPPSPVAFNYIKNHPATAFSLEASPIGPAELAKAGTVGTAEDLSDKQREANQLKDSAIGFFNARIQQYFTDPDFIKLSKADQDHVIDTQIDAWEKAGLPAGKFNEASPTAWMGVNGKNTLREAMKYYADNIRVNGAIGAQAPGGIFDNDAIAVQQVPTATQTAALSFTRAIPGLFGSNVGGELGAAAGSATGIPGAGIVGGVGGSLLGAFGGEKLVRGAIDQYGGEKTRNALEQLDTFTNLGEQEHPLAAWIGNFGGQGLHNSLGFQQILRESGFGKAIAPRLSGGLIGGGVEAASEKGRDEDLDIYKIGQAALSGTVFTKPRYIGEGAVPMSYEGRNWVDTNVPKPELFASVDAMFRAGKSPAEVIERLGNNLPDTPENKRALRIVSADIRAGRDPAQSMDKLGFRPNGMSVDRAVDAVNKHVEGWDNSPAIHIHDNYDSPSIPKDMADKVGPGTLGWKDENGEIHIVASQHADPAAINATMFHEGMHVGLVRAYQDGLEGKLNNVFDNANPRLQKALDAKWVEQAESRHDWDQMTDEQKKSLVTDEVLADTAEHGVHKEAFDKVSSWVRDFGRNHLGELGKKISYSDAEVRTILSTGHTAVSQGEGAALGPTRYLNFGIRSRGADLDSLESYDQYGGLPRKPEYDRGWFEGPVDNEPRYEVSDQKARLLPDNKLSETRPVKLNTVLDHPELFNAYPELADVKVKFDNDPSVNASWSKRDNTIFLNPKAADPLASIIHEVQHAIQDHEGWARGANVDSVYRTAPVDAINRVLDKGIPSDRDEWDARRAVRNDPDAAEQLYNRAGGEYEARAAASRLRWDDLDRLDHPQFQRVDDRGVRPADLYNPQSVDAPTSERPIQNPEEERPKYTSDDLAWFSALAEQRAEADNLKKARLALDNSKREQVRNELPGQTRFSRKYSGAFGNDYQGRQQRTEDLIGKRFGAFNNLKGMMRPLEEYNRVTDQDIKDAAQELKDQGFDAGLAVAQGAIPDNSGYVVALRDLVHEKLETASDVAGKYRASGGMRHERELMRAVTDLGQVLSVFDKTASNLGRMLHSLRLRIDEAPEAGLSRLFDRIRFANGHLDAVAMDDIAQALTSRDPLQIRKAIDKFDPNWKQYAQSLFYNHILGSLPVQLGNLMGNAAHITQKGLGDILGYGVGGAHELAFRAGDKLGMDVKAPDRMHSDELMNRISGLLGGMMNSRTYNGRAFNNAAKEFFVPAGQSEHVNKFASQSIENLPLSLALEYGTRGLQAGDAYFRTVVEHSAMQGLATREARKLNGGQKPTIEQVAEVMAQPTREMLKSVTDEADRITFQEQPFGTAERFSRLIRGIPGGWLVAPIIRTPSNIGRAAFESFDPTGRITQRNRDTIKAGGPEANRLAGQRLLAGAMWAGALYLMNNGLLHGGGPTNPQARAQWLLYSRPYTIGSPETGFIPLRGISPIGDGLSMIADMRDAGKFISKDPEMEAQDKAFMIAAGMSDAYLSNSFVSSVTDQLERGVKPSLQNLLGTVVQAGASIPLYSQIKKQNDPFVRDTSNEGSIAPSLAAKASLMDNPMMEHYFKGVKPRDELPIRRDFFGSPIMAASPTSKDPVALEVGRLVDTTGKAVVPSFSRTIKGMHVPDDLYNNFTAVAGPVIRQVVSAIMDDPIYKKALTDEQRAAIIRSNKSLKGVHERLGKQLQQMMLDRNPKFEGRYISDDLRTLSTIPGVDQ